jgi:hypothetical protein
MGPFRSWALGGRTGSPRVRSGPVLFTCFTISEVSNKKLALTCCDIIHHYYSEKERQCIFGEVGGPLDAFLPHAVTPIGRTDCRGSSPYAATDATVVGYCWYAASTRRAMGYSPARSPSQECGPTSWRSPSTMDQP